MAINTRKLLEFSRVLKEKGVDPALFNDMWREQEAFEGMGGKGWYFDNQDEALNQPPLGWDAPGGGMGGPMPNMGPNGLQKHPNKVPKNMPPGFRKAMGLPPAPGPGDEGEGEGEPLVPPDIALTPEEFDHEESEAAEEGERIRLQMEGDARMKAENEAKKQEDLRPDNLPGFFPNKEARGILNQPLLPVPDGKHTFRQDLRDRLDPPPLTQQQTDKAAMAEDAKRRRNQYRRFK